MFVPHSNYFINPTPYFIYKPLQRQLPIYPARDPTMCHYTIKFFECDHKTDDNVKGCSLWEKTGTHCDIDNPAVKKRKDCSIRSENVSGFCPRCQRLERARLLKEQEEERARMKRDQEKERARLEREFDEEMVRRDFEKAKLAEKEEQRQIAEAHEAHLRQVREESEASWRGEYKETTESYTTTTHTTTIHTTINTIEETSPPPPPPPVAAIPPAPALPPIDYSQPPKEQSYGHHFIGSRRQPIHESQKLPAEHPLSATAASNPRIPQPPARRAGTATPAVPSSRSSASGVSGASRSNRTHPPQKAPQGDFASELQAQWNRLGIRREMDEDEDDGITTATISPSESASQIDGGTSKGRRGQ